MHTIHTHILEIRGTLNSLRMSYASLSNKAGIHLSKLKRIFSGRQEITLNDYQNIFNIVSECNYSHCNLLSLFYASRRITLPTGTNNPPKAAGHSHQTGPALANAHLYDSKQARVLYATVPAVFDEWRVLKCLR